LLERLWQEWKQVEIDIQTITDEIERISKENALCRRLRQIPGFGPLVSTATVAAIGNGAAFRRGRDFAAWVGVVPRQYSTGGKQKLFGISKRGNIYLRRMLIHGARAVLLRVKYDTGGFGQWVHRLAQRAPRNKVIVAIANKLARIKLESLQLIWIALRSFAPRAHQECERKEDTERRRCFAHKCSHTAIRQRLFDSWRNQAIAQVCAFPAPKTAVLSVMAIFRQS
jgi:hypothetical protein